MTRKVFVLFLIALVVGCFPGSRQNGQQSMTTSKRETPWSVTYHDGSGNGFRFWQESQEGGAHFTYTPVTPAHSSSGVYSGGEAKSGPLEDVHVEELWQRVQRLASETSLHESSRMMGTGAFHLITPEGEQRFIVKRGPLLKELDDYLAQLRGHHHEGGTR